MSFRRRASKLTGKLDHQRDLEDVLQPPASIRWSKVIFFYSLTL